MVFRSRNQPQKPTSSTETDQLQTELEALRYENNKLQQRLNELESIFEHSPIMFWYKDDKNRVLRVNRSAAALEGVPISFLEGKTSEELYPPEQAAAFYRDDQEVIQSGKSKLDIVEQHTSPATGEVMWLQVGKVPYRQADGSISGVIAFAVDITVQKKIEESVRMTHAELEEAHRRMSRTHILFRATVEHMRSSLEHGAEPKEVLEYLNNIQREFDALNR